MNVITPEGGKSVVLAVKRRRLMIQVNKCNNSMLHVFHILDFIGLIILYELCLVR